MSAPPIIGPDVQTISADNVKNANSIGMARNINQSFYNSIAWKFEEDSLEEKLLGATVTTSEDSFNRVQNIGLRTLTIEAGGIRDTPENRNKIDVISFRFLDRYQFGAEVLKVQVDFKTAFKIEVGDTVILDGQSLNLSDSNTASREFLPRVMECTNRAINLKTGACSLELTDTNLGTRARYGTFSPASLVGTGSTLSEIAIKRSFSTLETELERDKWRDYVTQKITIRSPDHSTIYTTTLIGLSATNPNILLVNPPIGGLPSEDWIVESPIYDDSSKQAMQYWKSLHCYFTPQVDVVSATTTEITVDSGDISKFYVGAPVTIHLEDYSEDDTTTVAEINANTITLTKTLSFTPDNTYKIDLIGFEDEGAPYSFY